MEWLKLDVRVFKKLMYGNIATVHTESSKLTIPKILL